MSLPKLVYWKDLNGRFCSFQVAENIIVESNIWFNFGLVNGFFAPLMLRCRLVLIETICNVKKYDEAYYF